MLLISHVRTFCLIQGHEDGLLFSPKSFIVLHFIILELFLFSYFNVCICFPFDAFRNVIHCLGCLYMCNVFYHEPDFLPFSLHIQLFLIL